ncbi:MAG: 6-carboxytetrahydropterin synthase [Proteobacteria bacterium]|jgi:6-pyruvoyltetrahydropterin/6-carboxytetrahydropterin synthase|nr:6-carboxytetrahydropterin synthase [Pseudomonadota bacterium]
MNEFELQFSFSAAHFYHQKKWSPEKNRNTFGLCNLLPGHGHDYKVSVVFSDISHQDLARNTLLEIKKEWDHQHLNEVVETFKSGEEIPTTEMIAQKIFKKIHEISPELQPKSLKLFENESIWVEVGPNLSIYT